MERQGAASPGLLVLTTGLSKPFRRLDKYSAMLQELERHMENSHPDRGDTQRSVSVYKDIAVSNIASFLKFIFFLTLQTLGHLLSHEKAEGVGIASFDGSRERLARPRTKFIR